MTKSTSWTVWVCLGLLSLVLMVGGYEIWDRHGLLIGFILALTLNSLVFFYGDLRLLNLFDQTELEGQDPWGVLTMVARLCDKAGLPRPRVFLLHLSTPTAFSIGVTPKRSAVLLSEALLRELSREEIEAVIAFEIARISRQDTLGTTVASALASGVLFVSTLLDQTLFLQFLRPRRPCQLRPAATLFAPLTALLVRVSVTRKSFYSADALASSWLGNPQILARALWKLDSYNATIPMDVALADSHLFIVNPLTTCSWYRYFLVQPHVKHRIRMLTGQFPL